MHDTAAMTGEAFFRCYGDSIDRPSILEVGSMDSQATLRRLASPGGRYIGVDLAPGPNVDQVVTKGALLPFYSGEFHLVVSSSCLEHDSAFWFTFAEMARVVRNDGFIYVSAPSNGPYHMGPHDCWRFYGDAAQALCDWANQFTCDLRVVETFMVPPRADIWIDNVMVFGKPGSPECRSIRSWISQ